MGTTSLAKERVPPTFGDERGSMRFQILSLSGGGYLGLYSAAVLAELEAQTGRRVVDMFDLLAGTSIGGIVALGLAAGVSAASRPERRNVSAAPTTLSSDVSVSDAVDCAMPRSRAAAATPPARSTATSTRHCRTSISLLMTHRLYR